MTCERSAARADLYRLLSVAFDYPCVELIHALRSGEYQDAVAASARAAGLAAGELPPFDSADEEMESVYLQMFEFGRDGGRSCALRESAYDGVEPEARAPETANGQASLVEDLLRFYHYFGLRLSEDPARRRPPDHIVCQLEMLAWLSLLESGRAPTDEQAIGYRRAQRDFIGRHVAPWLRKVRQELASVDRAGAFTRFYLAAADLALAGVTAHLGSASHSLGECG